MSKDFTKRYFNVIGGDWTSDGYTVQLCTEEEEKDVTTFKDARLAVRYVLFARKILSRIFDDEYGMFSIWAT